MAVVLVIVLLWLFVACLIYGFFVHRSFGISADLRRFPRPGLAAAAVLGPGAAVGAHFAWPMPPVLAILFSAFTVNLPSVLLNAVAILVTAAAFLVVSWLLNRRAAAVTRQGHRVDR